MGRIHLDPKLIKFLDLDSDLSQIYWIWKDRIQKDRIQTQILWVIWINEFQMGPNYFSH